MIRNVSNCFQRFSYKVTVLKQIFPAIDWFNWTTSWDPKVSNLKTKPQNPRYNFQIIIYKNKFLK